MRIYDLIGAPQQVLGIPVKKGTPQEAKVMGSGS
jgi:hypothetical protein